MDYINVKELQATQHQGDGTYGKSRGCAVLIFVFYVSYLEIV